MESQNSLSIQGIVFDIQRYSIHDGPGIRTIIFLKGCPLKCIWCQNPEGQNQSVEIGFNPSKCIHCGKCAIICPTSSIDLNYKWRIDRNTCSLCTKCVEECYADALVIFGSKMTISEVMKEIEKDKPFYSETNGGVTISGGEPTLQMEFTYNLLLECKKQGISTVLETSGYFKWDKFEILLSVLDWVLFDLKLYNEKTHTHYCGHSNRKILQNAQKLSKEFPNVIFRMPIIPSVNDDKQNIKLICHFVKKQGKKKLHLIPYHKLGYGKYQMLGRYPSDGHIKLADQEVQIKVKKLVEKEGLIPVISF